MRRPWSPARYFATSVTSCGTNQSVSVNVSTSPSATARARSAAATGSGPYGGSAAGSVALVAFGGWPVAVALGLRTLVAFVASYTRSRTDPVGLLLSAIPTLAPRPALVASRGSSTRITPLTPFPRVNPGASDSIIFTGIAPPTERSAGFSAAYPGSSSTPVTTWYTSTSWSPRTWTFEGNRSVNCAGVRSPGANVCEVGETTPLCLVPGANVGSTVTDFHSKPAGRIE